MGLSQRFACKIVGQPRSTQRKALARDTPDDPDADLRKWLRDWAKANARKGFRRAWADLRAMGWVINKEEGSASLARGRIAGEGPKDS